MCLRCMPLRRDGGVRVHGPVDNRCPGSGKQPRIAAPLGHSFSSTESSPPATTVVADSSPGPPPSPAHVEGLHLQPPGKIVKRIPRASREHAASKLAAILDDVTAANNVASWTRLLNFPRRCLRVPVRGGSRWSLARQVNRQLTEECDPPPPPTAGTNWPLRSVRVKPYSPWPSMFQLSWKKATSEALSV